MSFTLLTHVGPAQAIMRAQHTTQIMHSLSPLHTATRACTSLCRTPPHTHTHTLSIYLSLSLSLSLSHCNSLVWCVAVCSLKQRSCAPSPTKSHGGRRLPVSTVVHHRLPKARTRIACACSPPECAAELSKALFAFQAPLPTVASFP